jgi:hypothetical protein
MKNCCERVGLRPETGRDLVIARYRENLEWAHGWQDRAFVYDKGPATDRLILPPNFHVESLANFGRDGHSFLFHIVEHYDDLAPTTLFLQGDANLHSPDPARLLEYRFKQTFPLSSYWREDSGYGGNATTGVPPRELRDRHRQYWIDDCPAWLEYLDHAAHPRLPEYWFDFGFQEFYIPRIRKRYRVPASTPIMQFIWSEFFGFAEPLPPLVPFTFGMMASVPRGAIRARPRATYRRVMEQLMTDDPYPGFMLERVWLPLFSYQDESLPGFWRCALSEQATTDCRRCILTDADLRGTASTGDGQSVSFYFRLRQNDVEPRRIQATSFEASADGRLCDLAAMVTKWCENCLVEDLMSLIEPLRQLTVNTPNEEPAQIVIAALRDAIPVHQMSAEVVHKSQISSAKTVRRSS